MFQIIVVTLESHLFNFKLRVLLCVRVLVEVCFDCVLVLCFVVGCEFSVEKRYIKKKKVRYCYFQHYDCVLTQLFMLTECSSLTNLQSLELRDNMLRQLPQSLSFLTKLRILDLGSNDIEELVSAHRGCLCICV